MVPILLIPLLDFANKKLKLFCWNGRLRIALITIHHNTENKPTNLRVSIYTLNFIPWRVDSVTSHDFSTTDLSLDEVHICHIAYPSTAMHKEQELSASPVCVLFGGKKHPAHYGF